MPITFTKSAAASAFKSLLYALIAIIVGGCFGGVMIYVSDIPMIVKITSALAVIMSVWMTFKLLREAIAYLQSGEAWRVEITKQHLSWYSPVPELMQSFQLPLNHIKTVRRICYIAKNSKASPRNKYFIEMHSGQAFEINEQISGIAPRKVFQALGEIGIPFHEETQRHGAAYKVGL